MKIKHNSDQEATPILLLVITKTTPITHAKKLSWEEIKKRSRNFSRVIGSRGFSTVYLARLPDSGLTAVKIQSACTKQLAQIQDQELQILLRLLHPNIVKFLGHFTTLGVHPDLTYIDFSGNEFTIGLQVKLPV
ncbi:hypothetical protein L1887_36055 [Cichorium endivia]|nr:hypothetical protein L1887_36055 [Cichorium endivia]